MSDEPANESTSPSFLSGLLPIIVLSILVVISLLAVCGLGYALFRTTGDDADGTEAEPTPFSQSGGSVTTGGPRNEALVYGMSDSTTV